MKKMRLFYSVISIIFMLTIIFGSTSSLALNPSSVHLIEDSTSYGYNLDQEKIDSKINNDYNPALYLLQEANSLAADQWSYATQNYYKNDVNWTRIDNSTVENLPFSHRYRINNNFDDWETLYEMTPGYVPTMLYTYTNPNVPNGTSLWSNITSGFPVLRFIPDYPVTISLEVNNITVDGEVDLFVYNSGGFVAQSTNLLPSFDSVTFTPTSEDVHVIEVRHPASDTVTNSEIILEVIQDVNPQLLNVYVGDDSKQYDSYNWHFTDPINSFGLLTPDTLDIKDVTATDDLAGSGGINYAEVNYPTPGVKSVYDNDTWSSDIFFQVTGTTSCNALLDPAVDECNGFLPVLFSSNDISTLGTDGVWTSLNPKGDNFGSNPQILKFMAYYGAVSSGTVDLIELVDDSANLIHTFGSTEFNVQTFSNFAQQYDVKMQAQNFATGNYHLGFYSSGFLVYEYSFSVDDSLYGNFNEPLINVGYEEVDNQKTLVFAKATDTDTTIDQIGFSYTTDNSIWTPIRNMTLLEGEKYGFIIDGLSSSVVNYSLTIYESAPDDTGNIRFKIRSALGSNTIDLDSDTNTTLDLKITPYGGSPSATNITFGLSSEFNVVPEIGSILLEAGFYRYEIRTILVTKQEYIYKFILIPKNPDLNGLNIPVRVESNAYQELSSIFLDVIGPITPFVVITTPTLNDLYNKIFEQYNFTLILEFQGGSPSTNATLDISSALGSFNNKFIQLDYQNIYPNVKYSFVITLDTIIDFEEISDDLMIILNFDDSTEEITEVLAVNPINFENLFSVSLVDPPTLSSTGEIQNLDLNISLTSNVNIALNNLVFTIATSGTAHSVSPNAISINNLPANGLKYISIVITFQADFEPQETTYTIEGTCSVLDNVVNFVIILETDFTPPVNTSTTNITSTDSTNPSSNAPPTPGFEFVYLFISLVFIIQVSRKIKVKK